MKIKYVVETNVDNINVDILISNISKNNLL